MSCKLSPNLHGIAKPVFWEKQGNIINLSSVSSTESAQRVVKVLCEWIHSKNLPLFFNTSVVDKKWFTGDSWH